MKNSNWALDSYSYSNTHKGNTGGFLKIIGILLISYAIYFAFSIIICGVGVWALTALNITAISGWTVAFSWKLVAIVAVVIMVFKIIF